MKPLTDRMYAVLRVLATSDKPLSCNQIARELGFWRGQDAGKHSHNGRAMGPAQRVIFPLIGLRTRGLVTYSFDAVLGPRQIGTQYVITTKGREFLNPPGAA